MGHTIKDQKKLLTRVRRIKGQSEALERALEAGSECAAILQQIAAIRGAVKDTCATTWAPWTAPPRSVTKTWNRSWACCVPI